VTKDTKQKVVIISNDIVPGLGMPVAAPGLRAYGLAKGLEANGYEVKMVVLKHVAENQWQKRGYSIPMPRPRDVHLVADRDLIGFLKMSVPAAAIMINSNQIDHLKPIEGIKYILDFFAPKMLEMAYQKEEHPAELLATLRQRKIRAIELADGFLVNGDKKFPYFLSWLFQADRDVRSLHMEVVNSCVPISKKKKRRDKITRLVMAGYLQPWLKFGGVLDLLKKYLDGPNVRLRVLMPRHWGKVDADFEERETLDEFCEHPAVETSGSMLFSDFVNFMLEADVGIDLFQHTLEREYAMVTRSIVALACGIPVVHPPFTEVSPMISGYDAGWLVDPQDTDRLDRVLKEIVSDREVVKTKAENARKLAVEKLDPKVAVEPLVRMLERLN